MLLSSLWVKTIARTTSTLTTIAGANTAGHEVSIMQLDRKRTKAQDQNEPCRLDAQNVSAEFFFLWRPYCLDVDGMLDVFDAHGAGFNH